MQNSDQLCGNHPDILQLLFEQTVLMNRGKSYDCSSFSQISVNHEGDIEKGSIVIEEFLSICCHGHRLSFIISSGCQASRWKSQLALGDPRGSITLHMK